MRISDWSSDVCSSDLAVAVATVPSVSTAHPTGRAPAAGYHHTIDLYIERQLAPITHGDTQSLQRDHNLHTQCIRGIQYRPCVDAVGVFERNLPIEHIVKPHHMDSAYGCSRKIGRASCRERVCQYV